MTRTRAAAIALLLFATAACRASASPTETGETGLVTLPTTEVLAPWKLHIGVYENGELGDPQPGSEIEIWRTRFTVGAGLLPNLEFTAQIPYIQFERDVPTHRHTDDVGGLRLGMKYRLLDESRGAPMSFALLGALVAGTGRDSFPAILDRASAWGRRETYEVMGIVDKALWTTPSGVKATFTLNAGGLFFDEPESFALQNQTLQFQRRFVGPNATFDNPFEFGAGVRFPLLATAGFEADLLGEFRGNTGIIDEVHGSLPTRTFTGLRLGASNGLALQGGGDFGLSGFLEPYRFIAGLTYAMPPATPPGPVAAAAPPPAPLPPPAAPVKKRIVLRGVNFDFDKATIRPDSMPILQLAAETLKENPGIRIAVVGHTDAKGTNAYNQSLGLRRASAVYGELEKLAVPGSRMSVHSQGEELPVAGNDTEDGRAQNRRVELVVQP